MKLTKSNAIAIAVVAVAVGVIVRANIGEPPPPATPTEARLPGTARGPSTSRDDLQQTIVATRARLAANPMDAASAVVLADALLRQARVTGNAGLAAEAERALTVVLTDEPLDYEARRMLATVYLSEHRFRDAIREAERARDQYPRDPWNYGAIGDAYIELGDYDQGFAAFQSMMDLRPSASAYARASYAFELRGQLERALDTMRMATDATSPRDLESLAWHHAQAGNLLLQLGRPREARQEFGWAEASFPGHPFAVLGRGRLMERDGDHAGALALYVDLFQNSPTPDLAAEIGRTNEALGNLDQAERYYALAESAWRVDAPEPKNLARFLADRGRKIPEAVAIAEGAAASRHDIFTDDALAWTYFKAGRLTEARAAMVRALRTGSRDPSIRAHASAITAATAVASAR